MQIFFGPEGGAVLLTHVGTFVYLLLYVFHFFILSSLVALSAESLQETGKRNWEIDNRMHFVLLCRFFSISTIMGAIFERGYWFQEMLLISFFLYLFSFEISSLLSTVHAFIPLSTSSPHIRGLTSATPHQMSDSDPAKIWYRGFPGAASYFPLSAPSANSFSKACTVCLYIFFGPSCYLYCSIMAPTSNCSLF